MRAREHDEQTQRYEEWLRSLESLNYLVAGFFLPPAGFPRSSEWFKALSYLDLLPCIEEGALTSTPMRAEKIVLESYVKTLASGSLRSELHAIENWEDQHE